MNGLRNQIGGGPRMIPQEPQQCPHRNTTRSAITLVKLPGETQRVPPPPALRYRWRPQPAGAGIVSNRWQSRYAQSALAGHLTLTEDRPAACSIPNAASRAQRFGPGILGELDPDGKTVAVKHRRLDIRNEGHRRRIAAAGMPDGAPCAAPLLPKAPPLPSPRRAGD